MKELAKLGIIGFKSDRSVRNYRKLWAENGDPDISPGDKVVLPDGEWPPTWTAP